jgi:hypothetical protein
MNGPNAPAVTRRPGVLLASTAQAALRGRMAPENFIRAGLLRAGLLRAGLILVPLAILVPLTLAACGSVAAGRSVAPAISAGSASPSGSGSPSGVASPDGVAMAQRPALCASQLVLTGLTIRRTGAVVRVPQEMFSFPPVTVASAAAARSLARALCVLPRHRPGIVNCPADLGIFYKLRFTAGRQRFSVVTVDASGCMLVHGLGQVRSAAGATAVWTALGRAYRLPGPIGRKVFLGSLHRAGTCTPPPAMLTKSGNCPAQASPG